MSTQNEYVALLLIVQIMTLSLYIKYAFLKYYEAGNGDLMTTLQSKEEEFQTQLQLLESHGKKRKREGLLNGKRSLKEIFDEGNVMVDKLINHSLLSESDSNMMMVKCNEDMVT
ncbi:hypothetical protein VNO80_08168 [Phaseolus coccineus]|uniref:Uncharacterized protein n=1 Tax=Phaseolus coccineus TaxID=3886 RepID=A0AAN9NKL0_PHACN